MAKRAKQNLTGETELLEDNADRKLKAAKKIAQANAILSEAEDPEPVPDPNDPSNMMHPSPEDLIPEPSKMERIISELGGDGKFTVEKIVAGRPIKVGVYPISDWPDQMEVIARQHGGGDYKIQFRDQRGHYVGQDTQSFDPKSYASGEPKVVDTNASSMDRIASMMERAMEQSRQEISETRAQMNLLMLELVRGAKSSDSSQFAEAFKLARESLAPQNPLESVKGILEVVTLLKSDGALEPQTPLNTAIDKAFTLLTPLLAAWAQKLTNPAPGTPGPVTPDASRALPPPVASAPSSRPLASLPNKPAPPAPVAGDPRIKVYADSLLAAASVGQPFEATANAILSLVGDKDEDLDQLEDMVNDPGFVGGILSANPALTAHQSWLVSLSAYLKEQLEQMAFAPETIEPAPDAVAGAAQDGSPAVAVPATPEVPSA